MSQPTPLQWSRVLGPVGLRSLHADPADTVRLAAEAGAGFALWDLAVARRGRRSSTTTLVDDLEEPDEGCAPEADEASPQLLPLLGHAGPSYARWAPERAWGPAEVETAFAGRRTEALGDEGWDQVTERFSAAALRLAADGFGALLINAESDSLLGASLSTLYDPDTPVPVRLSRLSRVVQAVRGAGVLVGILLVVEDGAPGGQDATAGIEAAQAAEMAGASLIISDSRSAWFEVRDGEACDEQYLQTARWLVGRVDVPVYAQIPARATDAAGLATTLDRATSLGLSGVVATGEMQR